MHAGRIDRDEFIQICLELLDFAKHVQQGLIKAVTRNFNLRGGKESRLGREALAKDKLEFLPLPFDCIEIPSSKERIEYLNTTTGFISTEKPPQDPRTFSTMAFTAARILVPCLSMALEHMSLRAYANEYLQSCESVLEVASSFRLLEGESGPTELSDLDTLVAICRSSRIEDQDTILASSYSRLEDIQIVYYALLKNIQGFASSLWIPDLQKGFRFDSFVPSNLSGPSTWEKVFTKRRANIIEDQARSCKEFEALIQECREWRKIGGAPLENCDAERRIALKNLRISQLEEKNSKAKARILSLAVYRLRKRTFRKSRPINHWPDITQPLRGN